MSDRGSVKQMSVEEKRARLAGGLGCNAKERSIDEARAAAAPRYSPSALAAAAAASEKGAEPVMSRKGLALRLGLVVVVAVVVVAAIVVAATFVQP